MPGAPVIFQGDERGILGEKEYYDAQRYPIQWESVDEGLISHYKKLARLRRETPILTGSVIRTYNSKGHLLSFFRGESGKGEILIVANNGIESITFELPEGVWRSLANGKEVIQDKGKIDILPLQVRIFEHM